MGGWGDLQLAGASLGGIRSKGCCAARVYTSGWYRGALAFDSLTRSCVQAGRWEGGCGVLTLISSIKLLYYHSVLYFIISN